MVCVFFAGGKELWICRLSTYKVGVIVLDCARVMLCSTVYGEEV